MTESDLAWCRVNNFDPTAYAAIRASAREEMSKECMLHQIFKTEEIAKNPERVGYFGWAEFGFAITDPLPAHPEGSEAAC